MTQIRFCWKIFGRIDIYISQFCEHTQGWCGITSFGNMCPCAWMTFVCLHIHGKTHLTEPRYYHNMSKRATRMVADVRAGQKKRKLCGQRERLFRPINMHMEGTVVLPMLNEDGNTLVENIQYEERTLHETPRWTDPSGGRMDVDGSETLCVQSSNVYTKCAPQLTRLYQNRKIRPKTIIVRTARLDVPKKNIVPPIEHGCSPLRQCWQWNDREKRICLFVLG